MKTSEAIKHFGSAAALARALGVRPPSVSGWGEYPPVTRQFQIQVVTKGKLKAEPVAKTKAA